MAFAMDYDVEVMKNMIDQLKQKLEDSFILAIDENELFKMYDDHQLPISSIFENVFNNLKNSILSIISVAKIPIEISHERTMKQMFENYFMQERILSVKDRLISEVNENENKISEEERLINAEKIASQKFIDRIKSWEGNREFWFHSLNFLHDCTYYQPSNTKFLNSSRELLNQATLLSWGALEILMRDYFVILLNNYPKKMEELLSNSTLRNKFDIKSIPTDTLIEYNFDLSGNMGNILIENFDFSNIDVIKALYSCLLQCTSLDQALKDNEIFKLYQRRNLIVHRGGIVDDKYLSKTNDKFPIGHKILIKPDELMIYINKIICVAIELKKHKIVIDKTVLGMQY